MPTAKVAKAVRQQARSRNLTHFDRSGQAHMVDVSAKPETRRIAIASGEIRMQPATLRAVLGGMAKKGDVLGVARIAAIQGAKNASNLIPLAHPIGLTRVAVNFTNSRARTAICLEVSAETIGRTGVEMEAISGVCAGLLTIYDMCKAIDRAMTLVDVRLEEKQGGRSGHFKRSSKKKK